MIVRLMILGWFYLPCSHEFGNLSRLFSVHYFIFSLLLLLVTDLSSLLTISLLFLIE